MEAEVIARYRAWVNSLPVFERDQPYLSFQGRYWTPNQVLREMELGTPTGKQLIAAEQKLMRRS
jgi:hypothetical protein